MIDYRPELKAKLETIGLPVYYELFLTKEAEMPCISYMLADDMVEETSNVLEYSRVYFYVKVWSNQIADLAHYSQKIDELMRTLGFTRGNATELWQDSVGQIQLRYSGLAKEYV